MYVQEFTITKVIVHESSPRQRGNNTRWGRLSELG
jgi:hypothetical protein